MIARSLQILGGIILVLSIAGAVGVGHFRIYYGPDNVKCRV